MKFERRRDGRIPPHDLSSTPEAKYNALVQSVKANSFIEESYPEFGFIVCRTP
jgi:hypothetical protein